jgi:hypothetical protein
MLNNEHGGTVRELGLPNFYRLTEAVGADRVTCWMPKDMDFFHTPVLTHD